MKQIGVELIMTSRKISLLLAASVFITGTTGAFLGSVTPSYAITSVDELTDVSAQHWAYEALRDLVEKYDVIEGYPDHTFRGERAATRWELAAALNALIKAVGRDLARLGAEKANKSDLQTLARLQEEFRNELNALQARTSALEARAAAIEAKNEEQDTRLTLLEKTQLHGDMSFGVLSDISAQGTGTDPDGILDGISAIGRLRLTMDVPVREDDEDSLIGRGDIHARLIGAFGRFAPSGAADQNLGAWNVYNGYSRIASDASAFNEGTFASTGGGFAAGANGNTRSTLYIENVHYKQHFKDGIPLLTDWMLDGSDNDAWETTGDLYVGLVPWRYLYDKSPYRGNELTQFQNAAFVNTPGIAVNYNMPMVAYQWHQKLGSDDLTLDLTTGVGSINVSDVMDGFNLTYEARLNYILGSLPGSLYGGGYHIWGLGNTGPENAIVAASTNRAGAPQALIETYNNNRDDINAFYVGWNQEWFEGVGTTINYMLSGSGRQALLYNSLNRSAGTNSYFINEGISVGVRQSISGVLSVPMSVFGVRDKDVFGVGYGVLDLQEGGLSGATPNFDDTWEQVVEAYYKWQFTDSISVVPSVQLIFNRLGIEQNDFTTVIGLRTNYTF